MLTAIEAAAFVYGCAVACCGGVKVGVMVAVALEHSATNGALTAVLRPFLTRNVEVAS